MSSISLTELQIDALKEVANIGAGHAATALSQLLGSTIALEAPKGEILRYRQLESRVGEDCDLVALHMHLLGDVPAQMVLMFGEDQALNFVHRFLNRVISDVRLFDSIVESTLKEIANVVAGSYVGALVQLTGANLVPSVPTLNHGTLKSVFRSLVTGPEGEVFLVDSTFLDGGVRVSGHFTLVPTTGSLAPLLAVFGVE